MRTNGHCKPVPTTRPRWPPFAPRNTVARRPGSSVCRRWACRQITACSGFQSDSMAPNWTAAATLSIPIFQGGRVEADVKNDRAIQKQRQAQVDNLRGSIEQDVQNALLDLKAASEQVEVAKTGLDYAQQTLEQSQDRFAAGVTNNVEVIQAQQQLASANEQYIASLYGHNIAKVLLARAIGNAEQAVRQYLAEPGSVLPAGPGSPNVRRRLRVTEAVHRPHRQRLPTMRQALREFPERRRRWHLHLQSIHEQHCAVAGG